MKKLKRFPKTSRKKITPRIKADALSSDQSAKYTRRVLDQTFRRALQRFRQWSRQSGFDTLDMEKEFYLRISASPTDSFTLTGKIDRVDTDGRYAAVCDYKTGSPKLSLNEIMEGPLSSLLPTCWRFQKQRIRKICFLPP